MKKRTKRMNLDLTGRQFGEWTVLRKSKKKGKLGITLWDCVCSCGKTQTVCTSNLEGGRSTRCRGCGRKRAAATCIRLGIYHGEAGTFLYGVWVRVKSDCEARWADYRTFKTDVLPQTDKRLVKRDASKPFGPGNFCWSSYRIPESDLIAIGGKAMTARGWANYLGLSHQRIYQLISKYGSLEAAMAARSVAANLSIEELVARYSEITTNWNKVMQPGPDERRRPHKSKYDGLPWEAWMNGETHLATQGIDFPGTTERFRHLLFVRGKKRGLKVRTRIDKADHGKITFRFREAT